MTDGRLVRPGVDCREAGITVAPFSARTPQEIEQAVKVEFLVNRRAAKAIGLALPLRLLRRADRVID